MDGKEEQKMKWMNFDFCEEVERKGMVLREVSKSKWMQPMEEERFSTNCHHCSHAIDIFIFILHNSF